MREEHMYLRAVMLDLEVLPLGGAGAIGYELTRRLYKVVSHKVNDSIIKINEYTIAKGRGWSNPPIK
jgi:hypothetical protein